MDDELEKKKLAELREYTKAVAKDAAAFAIRLRALNDGGVIGECQRPLRAQTAQGERVSLANSEEIPAGATCEFEVLCMDDTHEKAVYEWLDYGELRGIGQWRNSGKGRFVYEIDE